MPPLLADPLKELGDLLCELSDDVNARAEAQRQLVAAADEYRKERPPDVAKTRQALSDLQTALTKAGDRTARLNYLALDLFTGELGASRKLHASLHASLRAAVLAAKRALRIAKDLPNRQPDRERIILAYQVARILRDQLLTPPRLTRDDLQNRPGTRGGAAYARLLRQTFKLAEAPVVDDLWPYMEKALKLQVDLRDTFGIE